MNRYRQANHCEAAMTKRDASLEKCQCRLSTERKLRRLILGSQRITALPLHSLDKLA
ncbi:hypothetical protein [Hydrogenophaga sp. OTU3427]|uniref:hypothetical protein n=1 Tax=Hydrogenophaga sp. OTU3427 TaxID=3043856 RepID=UPI00313B1C6F